MFRITRPRPAVVALRAIAFLVLALPALALQAPPTYRMHVFPALAGQDSDFPTAMNAAGVIAGHSGDDPFSPLAVPITVRRPGATFLTQPTQSLNFALGISDAGFTLGTSSNQPVLWRGTSFMILPSVSGLHNGAAWDGNAAGQVCGTLYNDLTGADSAVVWSAPFATGIQLPHGAAFGAAAFAINDQGWVAGAVTGGPGSFPQAARWENHAALPVVLGALPGASVSEMRCINTAGDTAGRSSFPNFTTEAMLHDRASNTLVPLGQIGGTYSEALGINDAQQVVGTAAASGAAHAFLWQQGVMHDLNALVVVSSQPFLHVSRAVAIHNTGTILAEVVISSPIGPVSRMALLSP